MPWQLIAFTLVLASSASGAIWPPEIDAYKRQTVAPADTAVQADVWQEYGFVEGEKAVYQQGARKLTATAWRFNESTGAMAAFFWHAPAGGTPIPLMKNALAAKGVTLTAIGNYLVRFEGSYRPSASEIGFWVERFPGYRNRALPALPMFLPEGATSKHYVVGPRSLAAFLGELPAATAAFEFGTELLVARYPTPKGELRVVIAGFPNHAIARQQLRPFQQFAGLNARRSGSLVVVALPPVPEDAAQVLDKIKYDTVVEFSDTVPVRMPNIGGLVLSSFRMVGLLSLVGIGSGAAVAIVLLMRRRSRESGTSTDVMTRLNIG